MHFIDIIIFIIYFAVMLGVGIYFFKKNKNIEDYYIGGKSLGSWHIGLSVVATDVGGGFSIGLGGLGFTIGLAGSWMLFTGLIGAWLSAVVLIPIVSKLSVKHKFFTFPQIFEHFYNGKVALIAGIISAIGYIGFTSSQLLAGAKLASATFVDIDLMLYSYAFMVSGLFIPILVALYGKKPNSIAAILSMVIGGTTTVVLIISNLKLPLDLDANIFGITASTLVYFSVTFLIKKTAR